MRTLVIDTSGPVTGVALALDGEIRSVDRRGAGNHGSSLFGTIGECTGGEAENITEVVCSAGPGSFTGLRIGLSCAQGLALGWKVPLVMAPTFLCAAAAFRGIHRSVAVISDARREELFFGLFELERTTVTPIGELAIVPSRELAREIETRSGRSCGDTAIVDLHGLGAPLPGFRVEPPVSIARSIASAYADGLFRPGESPGKSLFSSVSAAVPAYLRAVSARTIAERREGIDSETSPR